MGPVGPIPLRDIVSLREQVTILQGYNWFYQDLFQSVTGFPHHWSTSQAYSPLLVHITKVEPADGCLFHIGKNLKKVHVYVTQTV
jgi:hypothetical protein